MNSFGNPNLVNDDAIDRLVKNHPDLVDRLLALPTHPGYGSIDDHDDDCSGCVHVHTHDVGCDICDWHDAYNDDDK